MTSQPTVLVVDDEVGIRNLLSSALKAADYGVVTAANAKEALALADEAAPGIDLLLADVIMPGTDGVTLAKELLRAHPGVRVLIMSGSALCGDEGSRWPVLPKPFGIPVLLKRVNETLSHTGHSR